MLWERDSYIQRAHKQFSFFLIVLRRSDEVVLNSDKSSHLIRANLERTRLAEVPVPLPVIIELVRILFRQIVNKLGEGDIVAEFFRLVRSVGPVFRHDFCTVTALELIRERIL